MIIDASIDATDLSSCKKKCGDLQFHSGSIVSQGFAGSRCVSCRGQVTSRARALGDVLLRHTMLPYALALMIDGSRGSLTRAQTISSRS